MSVTFPCRFLPCKAQLGAPLSPSRRLRFLQSPRPSRLLHPKRNEAAHEKCSPRSFLVELTHLPSTIISTTGEIFPSTQLVRRRCPFRTGTATTRFDPGDELLRGNISPTFTKSAKLTNCRLLFVR